MHILYHNGQLIYNENSILGNFWGKISKRAVMVCFNI